VSRVFINSHNLSFTLKMNELKTLEANHHARLSVAGAASVAVQMMNDNERKGFENWCSQRRQEVLSRYAWEFRNIMCVQQIILTKLGVPGFDGPTVDTRALEFQSHICTLLHTAFFLRKNLGERATQQNARDTKGSSDQRQRQLLAWPRRSDSHPETCLQFRHRAACQVPCFHPSNQYLDCRRHFHHLYLLVAMAFHRATHLQ
jgi:hypothetical protein